MKKILIMLALTVVFNQGKAQETATDSLPQIRSVAFDVKVYGPKKLIAHNYLLGVNDTAIALSSLPIPYQMPYNEHNLMQLIPSSEIEYITIRKKGATGRGAVIGVILGAIAGGSIGMVIDSEEPKLKHFTSITSSMVGAVALGLAGGILGAVIGSIPKKIQIGGQKEKVQALNMTVLERIYGR